jgi:hypothetical protein
MRRWKLLGMVGFVVVAVPMTAYAAAPDATTDFVLDLWNSRGYEQRIREQQDANAQMDSVLRETIDRMSVKEQLIGDLLAKRLTFFEVVKRFEALNAGRPAAFVWLPPALAQIPDEEKAARSVLSYVAARGNPVGAALPELAGEYETRYGRSHPGEN